MASKEIPKTIPTTFNIQIYGNLEYYSPTISKARARIFYRGRNRNDSYITEEFAEKLIQSLPYAPVKGIYDEEEEDFTSHGMINSLGKAYGVVPENGNGQWERHIDDDGIERTYYCTDILLWTTLYENAKKIPGKCQSMELDRKSIKGSWKEFDDFYAYEFTDGNFLGLQVLGTVNGEKVEPCFEGAAFYSKEQNQLLEQFSEILKIAKNYNLQEKEEKQMPEENKQQLQTVENEEKFSNSEENANNTIAEEGKTDKEQEVEKTSIEAEVPTPTEGNEAVPEGTHEEANPTTENYELLYTELKKEMDELSEKFSKLMNDFSVLTDKYNHLQVEKDALKEFKENTENAEKKQIIEKYSAVLPEDVIKQFSDKLSSYSVIELDKELCFEAHKNDTLEPQTTNFSYKNNEQVEESELKAYLNNYKIN